MKYSVEGFAEDLDELAGEPAYITKLAKLVRDIHIFGAYNCFFQQ